MKTCNCGGTARPFRRGQCNNCYQRKWGKENYNTEHATALIRKRYRDNPSAILLRSARHRAKVSGLPFNLTMADVVVPKVCPVLGIPINFEAKDNVPSLDRVIPEKGYVTGNVCVISWRANRLKSNGRLEEFQQIIVYLRNFLTITPCKSTLK